MEMKKILPLLTLLPMVVTPVRAESVHVVKQVMTPNVMTTSLKKKGNKYQFSFAKGKGVTPVRFKIVPLKVVHAGDVKITANKTKLTYATYSNEACTKSCQVNAPGQYYVKISQNAYAIDLTDHNYACYKKASITLYVSQISRDDFSLKEKSYAIFAGRPKIKIHASEGCLRIRSQRLNQAGKYVYDGTYSLMDLNGKKLNESVSGQGKMAVLKGDYYLIPDGKNAYRLKYTLLKAPYHKNTSKEKARLLSKSHTGVFFKGDLPNRFYKVKISQEQVIRFKISGISVTQVSMLSYDKEKSQSVALQATRDGQDFVYATDRLKAGTYYIKLSKEVTDACGYLYTIALV